MKRKLNIGKGKVGVLSARHVMKAGLSIYSLLLHICVYLNSISVHFYCIFFVSVLYSIICIQYLFISIVYVSFLFYIRSFVFNNL